MSITRLGLFNNNTIPVEDKGIVMNPATDPGDPMYRWDSCGMREAIVNKVGDTYYMFYDGASNFDNDPAVSCRNGYNHLWRTCLATSADLINWTKQGVKLNTSYDEHPANVGYIDWATATSPWVYFNSDDNYWYMYYLGCTTVSDTGVPSPMYVTLTAKAATAGLNGIAGSWNKMNDVAGQENHVTIRLPKGDGSYPTEGVSPGHVIQNPKWTGSSDTLNKRYIMFATSFWGINICRTNDLSATDSSTNTTTHQGWQPGSTELFGNNGIAQNPYNAENASYYYDATTQYHILFTNHIINADHADGFYVNWTKDSDNWDPANRALLMSRDTNTCTWSTGAIGMPSVVKVDDSKLAVIYDAVEGSGTGHLHRKIGLAYLNLPLVPLNDLTRTDCESSQISYGGTGWTSGINDPFCTESVIKYTNVTNDYASYTFYGDIIKWLGKRDVNRGIANVYIDGVLIESVDCYSPVLQCQQELFSKTFEIGTHTIKIVNSGTKNAHSSGTYIDLNEFRNADIATDCRIKL